MTNIYAINDPITSSPPLQRLASLAAPPEEKKGSLDELFDPLGRRIRATDQSSVFSGQEDADETGEEVHRSRKRAWRPDQLLDEAENLKRLKDSQETGALVVKPERPYTGAPIDSDFKRVFKFIQNVAGFMNAGELTGIFQNLVGQTIPRAYEELWDDDWNVLDSRYLLDWITTVVSLTKISTAIQGAMSEFQTNSYWGSTVQKAQLIDILRNDTALVMMSRFVAAYSFRVGTMHSSDWHAASSGVIHATEWIKCQSYFKSQFGLNILRAK